MIRECLARMEKDSQRRVKIVTELRNLLMSRSGSHDAECTSEAATVTNQGGLDSGGTVPCNTDHTVHTGHAP